MKITKYPDNSSYVSVPEKLPLSTTFRINSYEDLWHLNQYVDAFNSKSGGIRPDITIPCLFDAQADRRFHKNESHGLKLVCQFLNNMNATFKIFHPHNPDVVEALMDNVEIIGNEDFISECLKGLDISNLILMSPDAGGFKSLMKLCDTIEWVGETFSASKARTIEGMKQIIDRTNFKGKDIMIVDDICVKGGTFKGLSRLLKERNCGKLYLAVSHITAKEHGSEPVTDYFNKVFTTNSKFDSYLMDGNKGSTNLEVIKYF